MPACRRLLEQEYRGGRLYRPTAFYYRQWRAKSPHRRVDTLPSHSHGLEIKHYKCSKGHSDGRISVRRTVSHMTPSAWRSLAVANLSPVYVLSLSFALASWLP